MYSTANQLGGPFGPHIDLPSLRNSTAYACFLFVRFLFSTERQTSRLFCRVYQDDVDCRSWHRSCQAVPRRFDAELMAGIWDCLNGQPLSQDTIQYQPSMDQSKVPSLKSHRVVQRQHHCTKLVSSVHMNTCEHHKSLLNRRFSKAEAKLFPLRIEYGSMEHGTVLYCCYGAIRDAVCSECTGSRHLVAAAMMHARSCICVNC